MCHFMCSTADRSVFVAFLGLCLWHNIHSRDRSSACKGIFPYASVLQFIALYPLSEMCHFTYSSGDCSVFVAF